MPRAISRRAVLRWTVAGAVWTGSQAVAESKPVHVFAAASLKTALDDVIAGQSVFRVRAVYAGSSVLARQIQFGAPADIFISANPAWMDALELDGLLLDGTRRDLVSNQLVLIAAPGIDAQVKIAPGFDLAGALGNGYLAMALTDAVPAGMYGRQALTSLGVWDSVAARVAQADNVRAALRLVASGEAAFGVVYATDAAAEPGVRVIGPFPADSHDRIVYPGAVLNGAGPQAIEVWDRLSGPEARDTFLRHGFLAPERGA